MEQSGDPEAAPVASLEADPSSEPLDAPGTSDELSSPPRIGAYLAGQRKLRGVSREELCRLTHIPMRSLERLEEGHFDEVDDGFVRGFVRTVAGALGLDQHDTLARMSSEPQESEHGATIAVSLARALALVLGLLVIVGSVGLVSMTMVSHSEPQESPLVLRRDPVRALAEAQAETSTDGGSSLSAMIPATPAPDEPSESDEPAEEAAFDSSPVAAAAASASVAAEPSASPTVPTAPTTPRATAAPSDSGAASAPAPLTPRAPALGVPTMPIETPASGATDERQ